MGREHETMAADIRDGSADRRATPWPSAEPQTAVDFALLRRPSLTIRKKIALSFLVCFCVIGAVTLASLVTLSRIERKLHFLEVADTYTNQIQQARRFEKNYLLYGTGLDTARDYAGEAQTTLAGAATEFSSIVGQRPYDEMRSHLERYEQLLFRIATDTEGAAGSQRSALETEIREHGGQMVAAALRVAEAERRSVQSMLRLSRQMPIAALVILLVLILYITNFLARQLLAPLGRMVKATERVAQGDFTPLRPARRYRDEFTGLALAMNQMMQELNRRQEALAEAQKLRAVGTLTAGIAHELNNPINNISLTAEAMLEDAETLTTAQRLDLCRDLLSQTERAQGIVRNLLDFSRQREVHVECLDLGALLRSTIKLVGNQVMLAGARLDLDVPDDFPPISGDGQQLAQVFVNLFLNALDAVAQGGVIRVAARQAPGDSRYVQVEVSDNGKGIPPEVLPFVFDPFFTSGKAKGTGLGLSVSHGIVAKHGGTIRVDSSPERGATFTVSLPVHGPSEAGDQPAGPPLAPAAALPK
jgi:two-component system NtrC family sensor kinase